MRSSFAYSVAGASLLATLAGATACGEEGAAVPAPPSEGGLSDEGPPSDAGVAPSDATTGATPDSGSSAEGDAEAFTGLHCTVSPCVVALAAGGGHVCALLDDHTVRCWGQNYAGELGIGSVDAGRVTPAQTPVPTAVSGLPSAAQIAAGGYTNGFGTSCANTDDAGAMCWGSNSNGVLGLGPSDGAAPSLSLVPLSLDVGAVTALALGGLFGCALTSDGGISCWGDNSNSELGRAGGAGAYDPTPLPVNLPGTATAIATGIDHGCAILTDHSVVCWGAGDHGQIGQIVDSGVSLPQTVAGVAAAQISAGEASTCAITTAGGAVCWGGNQSGQLGRGAADAAAADPTPEPVALPAGLTVLQIASAVASSCALLSDRSVWCWGDNAYGELGTGSSVPGSSQTPAPVQGLSNIVQIASGPGASTICALLDDGSVRCWGVNYADQLGIDTSGDAAQPDESPHPTPLRVMF
jgi:alpha-tubulin suppressor-like RCC1 family protein